MKIPKISLKMDFLKIRKASFNYLTLKNPFSGQFWVLIRSVTINKPLIKLIFANTCVLRMHWAIYLEIYLVVKMHYFYELRKNFANTISLPTFTFNLIFIMSIFITATTWKARFSWRSAQLPPTVPTEGNDVNIRILHKHNGLS